MDFGKDVKWDFGKEGFGKVGFWESEILGKWDLGECDFGKF